MLIPRNGCGFFPSCWCGENVGFAFECRRPAVISEPPKEPPPKDALRAQAAELIERAAATAFGKVDVTEYKYIVSIEDRRAINLEFKETRDAMAKTYRALRAERPAMAKLLWRRARDAEKQMVAVIMSEGNA